MSLWLGFAGFDFDLNCLVFKCQLRLVTRFAWLFILSSRAGEDLTPSTDKYNQFSSCWPKSEGGGRVRMKRQFKCWWLACCCVWTSACLLLSRRWRDVRWRVMKLGLEEENKLQSDDGDGEVSLTWLSLCSGWGLFFSLNHMHTCVNQPWDLTMEKEAEKWMLLLDHWLIDYWFFEGRETKVVCIDKQINYGGEDQTVREAKETLLNGDDGEGLLFLNSSSKNDDDENEHRLTCFMSHSPFNFPAK